MTITHHILIAPICLATNAATAITAAAAVDGATFLLLLLRQFCDWCPIFGIATMSALKNNFGKKMKKGGNLFDGTDGQSEKSQYLIFLVLSKTHFFHF